GAARAPPRRTAPSEPAAIGTLRAWAAARRGGALAAPPPRQFYAGWQEGECLWARVTAGLTGVAGKLCSETRKGCGLTVALGHWEWELQCRRARGGGVAWPHPIDHEVQPHQGDQHQVGAK